MACSCSPAQVQRYGSKISGPLLDRLDLVVNVERIKNEFLTGSAESESSDAVRSRVEKIRKLQLNRFKNDGIKTNSEMGNKLIRKHCPLNDDAKALLDQAMVSLKLSARAYMRVLKVSRTIADMDEAKNIDKKHIAEAQQYRI